MMKLNRKFKKTISGAMAAAMVLIGSTGIVAQADTQTVTPTYDGKKVTCKLNCDFSLTGNDNATAVTSWSGKDNCKVKVELYCCSNAVSDYVLKDSTSSAKKAKVSASQSGVWRYRSKHAVVASDGSKTLRNLTTLTDW